MVAATLRFEGDSDEVDLQRKKLGKLIVRWGGMAGGGETGKAGYELTYSIAYLRDFAYKYGLLGESFETFVVYSKLEKMCESVKARVCLEHKRRGIRGEGERAKRASLVTAEMRRSCEIAVHGYIYY